jgi:hypothetical protein
MGQLLLMKVGSSVSVVTSQRAGRSRFDFRQKRGRHLFRLRHGVQIGSKARPAFYAVCSVTGSFPGIKVAGA